jgi:hypothetical protein
MTKEKIAQLHEDASNGIIRHELAANVLSEVCETALELFKIVEQQNTRLKKYQRACSPKYVPD